MQSKTRVTIFLLVLLCFANFTSSLHSETLSNKIQPVTHDIVIPSQHRPVSIRSDSDFETQGWPGNGSVNNPFRIENLSFETSGRFYYLINIENVSSHFVIQNCRFSLPPQHSGVGVSLREVSNGRIINSEFTHLSKGIFSDTVSNVTIANCSFKYSSEGIYFWKSNEVQISNNTFLHSYQGLQFELVVNSTVTNNTFLFNDGGIWIYNSSECNLTSNFIAYNREIGVELGYDCNLIRIFGNKIAFNRNARGQVDVNARDDGYDNLWDDNVSIGNEWGDYSGSGNYTIPGLAGSIDRFPSLADFDLVGPEIYHVTDWGVTITPGTCRDSALGFQAIVIDHSGVDSVLLYFRDYDGEIWQWIEMAPSATTPDAYTFYFEDPLNSGELFYRWQSIRYYYVWANDTIGLSSYSEILENTFVCSNETNRFSPSYIATIGITISFSSAFFIIILIRKKGYLKIQSR